MSGSLGGFGNQTSFGSGQDDHYRSWRDRQLAELDRDYEDYCREREQKFHSDFNTWRSSRTSQSPSRGYERAERRSWAQRRTQASERPPAR